MRLLQKIFPVLLLAQPGLGKEATNGKKSNCEDSRRKDITEIMNPAVTATAFYNPFPKPQTPSWIVRAVLVEPSSSGAMLYVEKVNFAEPDLVEWQNSFSVVGIESLGIKVRPNVPTDVICCSLDYLRWQEPNFEFGLKANGDDFACTIAPERFAKPVCNKKTTVKGG